MVNDNKEDLSKIQSKSIQNALINNLPSLEEEVNNVN